MEVYSMYGAMYAKLKHDDIIDLSPIQLGNGVLHPGEFVRRLGDKKRSSFEMNDGYYLRYVGKIDDTLLFGVNRYQNENIYYGFDYVDKATLFVFSGQGGWDIRIEKLEKFTDCQILDFAPEQMTMIF